MGQTLEITVLSGVSSGDIFRFDLDPTKDLRVGRAPECDLVLQDPQVSRNHAKIEIRDDGFYLTDLGSSHGTVHMGFQLKPGEPIGRRLSNFDEFKVGESIFRANFSDEIFAKKPTTDDTSTDITAKRSLLKQIKRKTKKKHVLLGVLALLLIVAAFVFLGDKGSKFPKQKSNISMELPQDRVIGYLIGGKKKNERDTAHLDKAQFVLPPSDLLIEYEIRSEAPIEVLIDSVPIEVIEPEPEFWQHRMVLVRDVLEGRERKLIFDNLGYPVAKGAKGKLKRWAVRFVRMTPLARSSQSSFDKQLNVVIGTVDNIGTSPDGLFSLVRALQRTLIEALIIERVDGLGVEISLESRLPGTQEMKGTFESLKLEREELGIDSVNERHISVLVGLLGKVDSQLWRDVTARFSEAEKKASVKNYIDAHDTLLAVLKMFPDEDDYRWEIANRMFMNKKIVPKRVRQKPRKYREKRR